METQLSPAVVAALSSLTEEQQLAMIEKFKQTVPAQSREERIKQWNEIAGSISKEDAAEMMAAIEEGCGQINHAAW